MFHTRISFCLLSVIFIALGSHKTLASEKDSTEYYLQQRFTGVWIDTTKGRVLIEEWRSTPDFAPLMMGTSKRVKGKDTVLTEKMQLLFDDGTYYFIASVAGQNNEQPIRFALRTVTDSSFLFENPTHDFPQIIHYRFEGDNIMRAHVEGINKGNELKLLFFFRRKQ